MTRETTTGTTGTTTGTTTTGTTTGTTTDRPRRGLSVRTRITVAVALLVTVALAGAGVIVYVVELGRIDASVQREVEQELDEFARLEEDGIDPDTRRPFASVDALLLTFLERNVPDDDELLVGWVGNGPERWFPDDPLVEDPSFLEAAEPLVEGGGTVRLDTDAGEVRITSQPVAQGETTGALLVVAYLDEDRDELRSTMRTYAIVALLALFIITWVAWWQSGRLLRPLRMLRRTAEEITETDLSRRVPETGNDDITALTRTANGMLDRLEAAFVGQRRFLDDAGHELKTPLTVLRGHLELLDPTDPAEVAETRALLLDEIDRMSRLVQDLILLAKSDRPDFLTLGEVDLADLITSVLAKARALGDRRWLLDAQTHATNGQLVVVDEQRLTQALLQLADNAVKHTGAGQEIALGAAIADSEVRLWVRDTGRGVDPRDRERIFERFGRSARDRDDEGFGLGLSIVRAIATAHGGTAGVEDPREGSGSCFVITLPVVRPERPDHVDDEPTVEIKEARWPAS
ncbi:sensor histidine kinase [Nocardioides silvaticus]|uniref:sensor histidine kinase n=1 Tax=Nocardioides silvaticus TaxID=2201891 RepID=UPI001FEA2311|nr:HAMP domain-containing sensor histidine kinase [Nocardioides silvaticus]